MTQQRFTAEPYGCTPNNVHWLDAHSVEDAARRWARMTYGPGVDVEVTSEEPMFANGGRYYRCYHMPPRFGRIPRSKFFVRVHD